MAYALRQMFTFEFAVLPTGETVAIVRLARRDDELVYETEYEARKAAEYGLELECSNLPSDATARRLYRA